MKYTAFVINIGTINPKIGKTKFGWNVFDSDAVVYECGGRLLYCASGTFKKGDEVVLRDNDSQKKLNTLTIRKECRGQKELFDFLTSEGYNMTTPRPFQKSVGYKYDPSNSYSVKGIENFKG